ncbi:hypothetical protein G5I_02594 [Acromyrmex echinatior]|uniref:Uncharacterized protein n=1 Tax=Acromyrmex echinatior TaxID=103372 RepID=F4WAQ5_ACREC|nr:hypothetical protein G5I_02594 [Acromyrmex echinatior]
MAKEIHRQRRPSKRQSPWLSPQGVKVAIPSGLIGIYDFSWSLSGPSFQFCQTVIKRLRSSLADANHSRDVEPKEKKSWRL